MLHFYDTNAVGTKSQAVHYVITLTLVLHKISSSEAYRAVSKALHGIFIGLSLIQVRFRKSEYSVLDDAIRGSAAVLGRSFMQHQG